MPRRESGNRRKRARRRATIKGTPRLSQAQARARLWRALTSPSGHTLLGDRLLDVEVLSGLYRPVGILAGSLAPRAAFDTALEWLYAVPERVIIPLLERFRVSYEGSSEPTRELPEIETLEKAYRGAGEGSSKCHVDRDDRLFGIVRTHRLVTKYDPLLPAPEEMPLSGTTGSREVQMRSAEEVLIAVSFAEAYGSYLEAAEKFRVDRSDDDRLREYASGYANLWDQVRGFERLALEIRWNRQRRLHNLILEGRKTRCCGE